MVFGVGSTEHGNGPATPAAGDTGAEKTVLVSDVSDHRNESIRSFRTEPAGRVARMREVHEFAQHGQILFGRFLFEYRNETGNPVVLVNWMTRRRFDGVGCVGIDFDERVRNTSKLS